MTEQQTDTGTALAQTIADNQARQGRATVFDMVRSMETEFAKALPKHMPLETFMRTAVTELRQTPALQACTVDSLLGAFMTAARLGLEVGGPMGQFYLTPRTVKNKSTGQHEKQVVPIIGYKGLIELATRSGKVGRIDADLVREGDTFKMGYDSRQGGKFILHEMLDYEETRPIQGVLAWADVGGGQLTRYLPIAAVDERRNRGSAGESGPWKTDREAMIRKTGIRALASVLPQSSALALASRVDETVQTYTPGSLDTTTGELTP